MNKYCFYIIAFLIMSGTNKTIYDFNLNSDVSLWRIVDDVVMGGKSNGNFKINKEGHGVFYGDVSLDNNGGFSSLRYRFPTIKVNDFTEVVLKLKGDQKKYQFRIKDKATNYYSFISTFETNGDWQTIIIPLTKMEPAFRGRKLNIDNFSSDSIEELAFLIGNKKEQSFKLEIDKIYLQ